MPTPPAVIEQTSVNGYTVSTIQYVRGDYETMVFDADENTVERFTHGTSDRIDAICYHRVTVELLKLGA